MSMSNKKTISVVKTIENRLRKKYPMLAPRRLSGEEMWGAERLEEKAAHALFMCTEIPKQLAAGKTEKAMRWLGFLQCLVLHCCVYPDLNSMKELNMPDETAQKKKCLEDALGTGYTVSLYVDTRLHGGVLLPESLAGQDQVMLHVGYNLAIPTDDLRMEEGGVRVTLSFNRRPFECFLPWASIYAIYEDGNTVNGRWDVKLPPVLFEQPEPPKPSGLRLVRSEEK